MASTKWITTSEVASKLNIHIETVRRWIRTGELPAVNIGGKGGYRMKKTDLDKFLQSRTIRQTKTQHTKKVVKS
jgi:excisionase family DNA binding protein